MTDALLVVWIALLGADRVDLLAGSGPFVLTPFLVLTPLVLATQLGRVVGGQGRLVVPGGAALYTMLATALLCCASVSVVLSGDVAMSAKRVFLLVTQLYATLLVALALANHPAWDRILVRGAYVGIATSLLFNIAQLTLWANGVVDQEREAGEIIHLVPSTYAGILPRLSGQVLDQNRGGFLLLIFLFVLFRYGRASRWRAAFATVGIVSLLLTLSRSVMLAGFGTWMLYTLLNRKVRLTRPQVAGVAGAAVLAFGLLLVSPRAQEAIQALGTLLSYRFSPSEGSASIHLMLIERGVEIGTSSVRNALLGIGFGSSYLMLQDLFPGDKYGNLHSLYVTLFAEAGVFALALGIMLLFVPLIRTGAFQPLIGGFILFNLFYQAHTEPAFWLFLALAWFGVERASRERAPAARPEAAMASTPAERPLAAGGVP